MAALLAESTLSFPHLGSGCDVRGRVEPDDGSLGGHQVAAAAGRRSSTPDCLQRMYLEVQRQYEAACVTPPSLDGVRDGVPAGVTPLALAGVPAGVKPPPFAGVPAGEMSPSLDGDPAGVLPDVTPPSLAGAPTDGVDSRRDVTAKAKPKAFADRSPHREGPNSADVTTAINYYADAGYDTPTDGPSPGGATCFIDELSLSGIDAASDSEVRCPTGDVTGPAGVPPTGRTTDDDDDDDDAARWLVVFCN